MSTDADATVRALLKAAGIQPSEEEIEAMIETYPGLRSAADGLYLAEASRYLPTFEPTDTCTKAE